MRVLVTDADDRKCLAAVRALGRRGEEVWVTGPRRWGQSFYSRYCRGRLSCPDPGRDFELFCARMLRIAREGHFDVLLPMSDYAVAFASRHREELSQHLALAVPEYSTLRRANSKLELIGLGRKLGLKVPGTWCPAGEAELKSVAEQLSYPCVLKPCRGAGAAGVRYPGSAEELLRLWRGERPPSDLVYDHRRLLVQEYIPGDVFDVNLLCNEGEIVAAVAQRRIRTYPPSGGRSTACVTVDRSDLLEPAALLVRQLAWHGPGAVEFKMDARDGRPALIEMNARFWGSLGCSVRAGVDFPHLACRIALGEPVRPQFHYEVGRTYRYVVPLELVHVLRRPDRLRALSEVLQVEPGTRTNIELSDLAPTVVKGARCALKAAQMLQKRLKKCLGARQGSTRQRTVTGRNSPRAERGGAPL